MKTPYEILGEDGVRRLADAFYDCMDELPEAADIRRMHGPDLSIIRQKFFEYLSGWFGGPQLYAQKYGGVCMTSPHKPYAIGPKERDQWLLCMQGALQRIEASEELQEMLREPFFAIADMVRNRD